MRRAIRTGALILAWAIALLAAPAVAAGLVQATDFKADAQDAAKRRVPILVLFSSPHCHYCERVKREYLEPMQKDRAYRNKVLIREVTVGATTPLVDFDGSTTTEGAFASQHKVFMVPTIKVLDTRGKAASDPIVGLLIPDYYFGYLDDAIQAGTRAVRAK